MNENPYASPSIPAEFSADANRPREMKIATQGKRFINLIVDTIVIQVFSAAGGFVLGVLYAIVKVSSGGTITKEDEFTLRVMGYLWGIMIAMGYFIAMESLFQKTVAKFLTGTLVVADDGRRASFKQILGRSFARLIPFEAFSFLGGQQPVGWHDSLSGTRVISAT